MKFKCPVCGSNGIEVLEMEYKDHTDLVRCLGCGELLEYTKGDAIISIMQKSTRKKVTKQLLFLNLEKIQVKNRIQGNSKYYEGS